MAIIAKAQDAHFAGAQEMNIWYNPALKTNKMPQAHLNIRKVNYPNIVSYSSKAATIELPLIGREKDAADQIPFADLAVGINTDNSSDRFMNVSTAMMAFSYALPLNGDDTYLSAGFQGNYTFSRVGLGGSEHFPDQFDKYGAFRSAIPNDLPQSGYSYGFFTAGAGIAIFHNGEKRQWYAGMSIRHFNHPYTEWTHSDRLQENKGIQAGYSTAVADNDIIGGYCNFSWQNSDKEQIIGAMYTRILDDSLNNTISAGISYRAGDALVPNIGLKFGANWVSFRYEINLPNAAFNNYYRKAFAFAYRRDL